MNQEHIAPVGVLQYGDSGPNTPGTSPSKVPDIPHEDVEELLQLCDRLADLLSRTAVALRGPEPPLTRWSWHDLPDRAAAAIATIDLLQRALRHIAITDDADCTMAHNPQAMTDMARDALAKVPA